MNKIKKFISKITYHNVNEMTKKWINRIMAIVLFLLSITPFYFYMLLLLHLKKGLSYRMNKLYVENWRVIVVVGIFGLLGTFAGYMWKAYAAKRNEEANKKDTLIEKLKKENKKLKGE